MKSTLTTALLSAVSILSCLADPKGDVKAAADKLAASPNYAWSAETEIAGGQFQSTPVNGKSEKDGYTVLTQERDGTTTTAVLKGEHGVVKTDEGWKTAEDLRSGGGQGRGNFRASMLLRTRPPALEAAEILKHVKELKMADGAISGDLTADGARQIMSFNRGRSGNAFPEPTNTKGSVKYWLKDGALSRMQVKLSGTYSFNGEDRDIERTTTVEIKDVGAAKVEVPEDARKKLGA